MNIERKVCVLCGQEGHRSHSCRWRAMVTPHQAYSSEKSEWINQNPHATPAQIEAQAQRIAERLGI